MNIPSADSKHGHHKWAMEAKQLGYPLCRECQEPIPKRMWKTLERDGHLCPQCIESYAKIASQSLRAPDEPDELEWESPPFRQRRRKRG